MFSTHIPNCQYLHKVLLNAPSLRIFKNATSFMTFSPQMLTLFAFIKICLYSTLNYSSLGFLPGYTFLQTPKQGRPGVEVDLIAIYPKFCACCFFTPFEYFEVSLYLALEHIAFFNHYIGHPSHKFFDKLGKLLKCISSTIF